MMLHSVRFRNSIFPGIVLALASITAWGCSPRAAGQVELYRVDDDGRIASFSSTSKFGARAALPTWGDPVRSNDDVVTIQVESAYIQNLPLRLTGSRDVIVFVDVWENASMGYNSPASLTSIVYIGTNQKIPGRLNFRDSLAYGPTNFKGHPLRVRFTVMVLQKRSADQHSSVIDVIGTLAETAAPQYSVITSEVAKMLKGILKAQPDIVFFDFDANFLSDRPEGLKIIVSTKGAKKPTKEIVEGTEAPIIPGQTPPASPARLAPLTTGEGIGWLRYGRYALVETEAYKRSSKLPVLRPLTRTIENQDGWLTDGGTTPLATNYLVFRVTPGQLNQTDEVLRSAADANAELLNVLRRSDAEIAEGLKAITDSAASLKLQVLRGKAEDLARRIVQEGEADGKCLSKADFKKNFEAQWKRITDRLKASEKTDADSIGKGVMEHWQAKLKETCP